MSNLEKLQNLLRELSLESFFLPINDEFLTEYVTDYNRRLYWLTGFSGSFANCIITINDAYFFTDSRYIIQAKNELPQQYKIYDIKEKTPWQLAAELGLVLAYDAKLVTLVFLQNFTTNIIALDYNPIDLLKAKEPCFPTNICKTKTIIAKHKLQYSGEETISKCQKVVRDYPLFLTDPESICWLLNIRGNDIEYTPIVLARAILYPDKKIKLFITNTNYYVNGVNSIDSINSNNTNHDDNNNCIEGHINSYEIFPITALESHLIAEEKIILDKAKTSKYFIDLLGEEKIIYLSDPCELLKACKNKTEILGSIKAHERDGRAVKNFLNWLVNNVETTELKAAEMLEKFREKQPLFQGLSFPTISAFGPNAAIVHYHPDEKSDTKITKENLFLFDSGAQYLDGTTDVTRTICLGAPTKEQQFHYTLVLKAHIALSMAVFPAGTTGRQLDSLARVHLWRQGLDYGHGTGHGVGSYLNVHEGPQSFGNNTPLKEGMIISNEPGFYKEGNYGIRLENLMYTAKHKQYENFLYFEILTKIPFDEKLINFSLLTIEEAKWLKSYQAFSCLD